MVRTCASWTLISAAVAALAGGCSPQPSAAAVAITEYALNPDSLRVQADSVAGEIVRMKVTQRIDQDSGRSVSRARLSGRLFLQNVSAHEAVRLIGATITYVDGAGQPIPLESGHAAPKFTFAASSGAFGALQPGQNATELLDAEFPLQALLAKSLKEVRIHLELSNVPRVETLSFALSIAAP